jgi:hypothetical protein
MDSRANEAVTFKSDRKLKGVDGLHHAIISPQIWCLRFQIPTRNLSSQEAAQWTSTNAKFLCAGDRTSVVNIESVLDGIRNCTATSEVLSPIRVQDMDGTLKAWTHHSDTDFWGWHTGEHVLLQETWKSSQLQCMQVAYSDQKKKEKPVSGNQLI